jgi:DNA-directed RNA polymerase specialized sigma24 family protein
MYEVYRDIDQHLPHLRRYAQAVSHNPVAADDLVRKSVIKALAKAHLYRPGTDLRAWLFTILHNQSLLEAGRAAPSRVPSADLSAGPVAPGSGPRNGQRNGQRNGRRPKPAAAQAPSRDTDMVMVAVEKALRMMPDGQRVLLALMNWDEEPGERRAVNGRDAAMAVGSGAPLRHSVVSAKANGNGRIQPSQPRRPDGVATPSKTHVA